MTAFDSAVIHFPLFAFALLIDLLLLDCQCGAVSQTHLMRDEGCQFWEPIPSLAAALSSTSAPWGSLSPP